MDTIGGIRYLGPMNERLTVATATLANKMMLTPNQAVALPAVLDKASASVGMSREALIARCMDDSAVSNYLASVARSVTSQMIR